MKRYIDADVLKTNIRVNLMPNVDVDGTVTVENAERYFLNLIDKTSTADVVEVNHGEWLDDVKVISTVGIVDTKALVGYRCSLCGRAEITKEPYCNCGAKMVISKMEITTEGSDTE